MHYNQTNVPAGLTGVTAIAAGGYHTVALALPILGFGLQTPGTTSAAKTLTIKNTGNAALSISSVRLIGGNASDFTVSTAGMLTSVPETTGETTVHRHLHPQCCRCPADDAACAQ